MAKSKFWHLASPESTRKLAEWDDDKMDLEGVICPVNDGHQRAGKRLTDLSIVLPNGPVDDFVWTWYSECLLQDHVLSLFKSRGLSGFQVKPIKARFKRTTEVQPPNLWELVVTGWAGMASPSSGIRFEQRCDACGHTVYSGFKNPAELISESQWDGCDIFMVWPLPRFVFVTDRVADTIREADLKGARVLALTELGSADFHSPGRLSYAMPEPRARQLGDPLGIY